MKIHKEMYYFKSSEVLPTVRDADFHGYILVWDDVAWREEEFYRAMDYSHWMQKPKAPDVNDEEF